MKPILLFLILLTHAFSQTADKATVQTEIGDDGNKLIIEAHGVKPETPLFYNVEVKSQTMFFPQVIREQAIFNFSIIQGEAKSLSVELFADARVRQVTGDQVKEWSVRKEGDQRFLDLVPKDPKATKTLIANALFERRDFDLPFEMEATSFGPGDASGFTAQYLLSDKGLSYRLISADGAIPLEEEGKLFVTDEVALMVEVFRPASRPQSVELREMKLTGSLKGDSAIFTLTGLANVTGEEEVSLDLLSGKAAPMMGHEKLSLIYRDEVPVYQLTFQEAGVYPVEFTFVAPVILKEGESWRGFDFTVPGGSVVPLVLTGLPPSVSFLPTKSIVLVEGQGFLPASGQVDLAWQTKRETGDGKLFFTSEALTDVSVGAGLLRQTTSLKVKALQGAFESLTLNLEGTGEILAVEGKNILSWAVEDARLLVHLSGPVKSETQFTIRSQTALEVLPIQVEPLRLTPNGAVRHYGHVRIFNEGAVRLEVMNVSGFTQLSPEQYPEVRSVQARQIFYYRYPSANRSYRVAAARVKPEINLSQVLVYEMTETDRILHADLELDIREAGIREWELQIPSDYSVVAVTGADVVDYVAQKERLKVIFGKEIMGRRLVKLHLEKNEGAKAGSWQLPALSYPGIQSIRGELGVSAVPGFRITSGQLSGLVDIPLAHFQKGNARMQQVYRIRNDQWSATMKVEALGQNIQADTFHLYSLKENTAYVSVLLNYFVSGAPVNEWKLTVPVGIENLSVDGQDVRDFRQSETELTVPLHRPVMGAYQLLVTYEQDAREKLTLGDLTPVGAQGERGYMQVVSPEQVELRDVALSENLVELDPLELRAEYTLLSHAPSLKAWQYTARPFQVSTQVQWYERGEVDRQVIEYAELSSRISRDGGVVTEASYHVRSQGERTLQLTVPNEVTIHEVKVNGNTVTIRKAKEEEQARLIPLPDSINAKDPVLVEMRSSLDSSGDTVTLMVPAVSHSTQLMTHWKVAADSGRVLHPLRSSGLELLTASQRENGFDWIVKNALMEFGVILFALVIVWRMVCCGSRWGSFVGALLLIVLLLGSLKMSSLGWRQESELSQVLEYAVPVLAPEMSLNLQVRHEAVEETRTSKLGGLLVILGLGALLFAWRLSGLRRLLMVLGGVALSCGLLLFVAGAGWFFLLLAIVLLGLLITAILQRWRDWIMVCKRSTPGVVMLLFFLNIPEADAGPRWPSAAELHEKWELRANRIKASASMTISGEAGEKFLLLHSPGILTDFQGEGLKVVNEKANYFVVPEEDGIHELSFSYEAPAADPVKGLSLLTTIAAVRSLELHYEAAGWGIHSAQAVGHEVLQPEQGSAAKLWFGPALDVKVMLSPRARDVAAEETRFYAEVDNLFVPGPGVVDGRHRVNIRPSQGQLNKLSVLIPKGFTVSNVRSAFIGPWRFDPERSVLELEFTSSQSKPFAFLIATQRSLAELPAEVTVAPVRIPQASGDVGMVALAFGQEAQLDQDQPTGLSLVNVADFNAAMLPKKASLQKVYRYSKAEASLNVKVAPVTPEVRITSEQKLSLGDERIVLGVDFTARITRAGVFRLSFLLPSGFEVESLSGAALNHWTEIEEKKQRIVVLNLNGKTLGEQKFHLVLAGASPSLPIKNWQVPRFLIREAARDSGQLVVVPGRGIQLQAASRKDVSALDPRSVGGYQPGSLAYRLLQKSWTVGLAVDQLKPSIAVRALQEVELRESYSKTRYHLETSVDHASVRSLRVILPKLTETDLRTVNASGAEVRDIVQVEDQLWEIQFKRRVVGQVDVRIDYHQNAENTAIAAVLVPDARKQEVYLALRPGSQLELALGNHAGWTQASWETLPKGLRQPGASGVPSKFLRSIDPVNPVTVSLQRHTVVMGSKIRVKSGKLLTVVSPVGELMNQADLSLEIIQRGSLELTLPPASRLFGVFVNEESATVVKKGDSYLFKLVGAAGGNQAQVRIYYASTLSEGTLDQLSLSAFKIGESLENVEWLVSLPRGYELEDSGGDLDYHSRKETDDISEKQYLHLVTLRKAMREKDARGRLAQVSALIKGGYNGRAAITLEQVSNQFSLDEASNEDARVQFGNVVTQQAVLGLNTMLQRNYLDNRAELGAGLLNDQLEVAANSNPVFAGNLNYRQDDFTNVVEANNADVNKAIGTIAEKWVKHQRVTEPVTPMLDPVISEAGQTYIFRRGIQVSGEEALHLNLKLKKAQSGNLWTFLILFLIVLAVSIVGLTSPRRKERAAS